MGIPGFILATIGGRPMLLANSFSRAVMVAGLVAAGTGISVAGSPQEGVYCPDGSTATISDNNRELHCHSGSSGRWAFPEGGGNYWGHLPSRGVRCPAHFEGQKRFGGRGIRCRIDDTLMAADCDFGWTLRIDKIGKEDRCHGVTNGPTKPALMTKIEFDIDRSRGDVSWTLQKLTGPDYWLRRVYKYPTP